MLEMRNSLDCVRYKLEVVGFSESSIDKCLLEFIKVKVSRHGTSKSSVAIKRIICSPFMMRCSIKNKNDAIFHKMNQDHVFVNNSKHWLKTKKAE